MDKLYKFILPTLTILVIVLATVGVFFPKIATAVCIPTETACVATSCGSSLGTKQVPVYENVCDESCPTVNFSADRWVCPNGYNNIGNGWCIKHLDLKRATFETFEKDVVYGIKSSDPNHCHRPTGSSIDVPAWAMSDFNKLPELMDIIKENCDNVFVGFETVSCNDAPIIPCEEQCPTECGYEGGEVANGEGGYKICPPTNSCSTKRWCFPTDAEETPTGYIAQAISIDENPEIGKPWESGKMIDKYCSYTPAGQCPTACGLASSEVPDGKGGYTTCPATSACPVDTDDDDGDILGTTDVVTTSSVVKAATGPSDNVMIYVLEMILVISTLASSYILGKKLITK